MQGCRCGSRDLLEAGQSRMLGEEEQNGERVGAKKPFFSGGRGETTAAYGEGRIGPGAEIGPFKVLTVLGEGGYGVVYLADQEHPIRRRVALKIVKPGMDSLQVIARFEAERQALALLDHPNIAQIHDAGTTPQGRPYFAMEYIEGLPITEYCDREKLDLKERLGLFLQVCHAIRHAHQKGIIHRDLKPSNILVTAVDDRPLVKVIDFGIAKALSQPLTEQTLYTERGQFIGTPDYMSPEQAEMDTRGVDTRSDVYSLGVVLYELLTGVLPFDPADLRSRGVDHIRAVIREQEPRTPSTRLSSLGETTERIAEQRRTDPQTLARLLRRELEWIPLKAMRKEPARRYHSAAELADDIQNYLLGRPLLAGPESVPYRVRKFVRRHAVIVGAATAMLLTLLVGLVVSMAMYSRAEAARGKEVTLRRQIQAQVYASNMSLAQQALAINDLGRARRLMETSRPASGEADLRNWEWRYLHQECQSDAIGELCRYPAITRSVAYSPDGRLLAVAGAFVEIWDVPNHRRTASLQTNDGRLVAFSPRGDLLASDAGNYIRLWRTGMWDLVGQLPLADNVQALKFSPDGTRLAILSYSHEVAVWEVDGRTVVHRVPGISSLDWQGVLDFSPDGNVLLMGESNHHVQAVDITSGDTILDIPQAHPEPITCVAWSPNGFVIASGSGFAGGPIRLWDAASGKPLGALEGHTSWISRLVFSVDGRRLYSASADQTVRIWDVGQRRCSATLRGSSDEVWGLALSPDGATLASSGRDGIVAFWDAHPRAEEAQPKLITLGEFAQPAFAPGGRILAIPRAGIVSLLDTDTWAETEQIHAVGIDISAVAYSPDGTLLVSGSRSGIIRVWSCAEHRLLCNLSDANAPGRLLRFRGDGRRLLSVDAQGKAIWWDTYTWEVVRTFTLSPFLSAAVSPDGCRLIVGDAEAVRWLNAETGESLATASANHRHRVMSVAFSDDGSQAASTALDGTVAIWNPSSFQPIAAFNGHMQGIHAVAFSPDGRRLATGGNGRDAVKLWDLSTDRELMTLAGQGFMFGFLEFSPDGRWLAACGIEGELHLWRAPSWEEIEAAEKRQPSGLSR